ncbi:MAG: hypothetical protein U5M51_14105 [Emticicia sp.]|nr:hypothetical protein [Emticicia sp.]
MLGKISPYDVMNDSYPKTTFNNYIKKTYENQIMAVPTLIVMYDYVYSQKNAINLATTTRYADH